MLGDTGSPMINGVKTSVCKSAFCKQVFTNQKETQA